MRTQHAIRTYRGDTIQYNVADNTTLHQKFPQSVTLVAYILYNLSLLCIHKNIKNKIR